MLDPMTEPGRDQPARTDASLRTMLGVAAWGALSTGGAFQLSGGSVVWFLIWMIVIGIAVRLLAYAVVTRRGETPPPGWWI
jgi:hypothetical protein